MRPSIATRANLDLLEENYRRWQENPESVDSGWSAFFEGFELGNLPQRNGAVAVKGAPPHAEPREAQLQTRVDGLVYAYRTLGHTIALVNPLAEKRPENSSLTLMEADSFEVFLHSRYVGQKRFSLQGAESLMVILDTVLHKCPPAAVEEICMGMAHRGRLNVLANFLKKSLRVIFTEFSENYIPEFVSGDGDVKYHLGYRTVRKLSSGAEVEIRLSANPSHLEAVDPVVEGTARARQRIRGDTENRKKVLP